MILLSGAYKKIDCVFLFTECRKTAFHKWIQYKILIFFYFFGKKLTHIFLPHNIHVVVNLYSGIHNCPNKNSRRGFRRDLTEIMFEDLKELVWHL